jgi:hypothetical protein
MSPHQKARVRRGSIARLDKHFTFLSPPEEAKKCMIGLERPYNLIILSKMNVFEIESR